MKKNKFILLNIILLTLTITLSLSKQAASFFERNKNKAFFENYSSLNKCIGNKLDFFSYKINLKKCYASKNILFSLESLNKISPKITNIFSNIPINNKFASSKPDYKIRLSEETPVALEKFIKEHPQFIYGFHQEVIWLSEMSIISENDRNILLTTAYNSFQPILLAQASAASTTGASSGASAAGASGAGAAGGASAGAAAGGASVGAAAGAAAGATAGAAAAAASVAVTTTAVAVGVASAAVAVSSSASDNENSSGSTGIPINLSVSGNSISENGSSLTITATAAEEVEQDIVVSISTSGTSSEGTDYSNISNITIASGSTSGSTNFVVLDDASDPIFEEDETAILTISSVSSGASIGGTSSQTITITENETAPTVTLSGTASIDEKTGTATITATSSIKTDSNMTVSMTKGGTATETTDYSLSNITITAGATSGTSTLTPVNDTNYEGGSETVTLSIASVSGISDASGASGTITITITNKALNSGTTATYNSSVASGYLSNTEFQKIEDLSSRKSIDDSPWETINLHQAWGYQKYGSGQQIAIVDEGFYLTEAGASADHSDLDGKTVTAFGSFNTAVYSDDGDSTNDNNHGTAVAGAAAADLDSTFSVGVAPSASLHISSSSNKGSYSNLYEHLAAATANASSAVVQNNSWGHEVLVSTTQNSMTSNSWSAAQAFSQAIFSTTGGASSVTNYVNALNDFQDHGVIVYALSNDSSFSDADISAGLAVLFSDLNEAFISAVNIDKQGSSGSYTYTRKSAPCGQTAPHCLAADGWFITLPNHVAGSTSYVKNTQGTSFVAPTISGAIAILAEHFPNQTPEQWVDRLLASANNDLNGTFSQAGTVTFGNGVVHGYSTEAGHGMLDLYAALQPITADSAARGMVIYSGSTNTGGRSFNLYDSRILSSRSFGDSIINGLDGIDNYTFDALSGGFKYDMSGHVSQVANNAPMIDLDRELNNSNFRKIDNNDTSLNWKMDFSGSAMDEKIDISSKKSKRYITTVASASAPVQNFYYINQNFEHLYHEYQVPYLSPSEGGVGFSFLKSNYKDRILFGVSNPATTSTDNNLGKERSLVLGYDHKFNDNLILGSIFGIAQEKDSFLNLKGEGAFNLENSESDTNFGGLKVNYKTTKNGQISTLINFANTNFRGSENSLLTGANNIISSSYFFGYNHKKIFSNDEILFYFSQPNRVEKGDINLKLTNLPDKKGNITYTNYSVNLLPSGRQKDFGISYKKIVNKDYFLNLKFIGTKENNHVKENKDVFSKFLGLGYKNLSFGGTNFSNRKGFDTKLIYNINF